MGIMVVYSLQVLWVMQVLYHQPQEIECKNTGPTSRRKRLLKLGFGVRPVECRVSGCRGLGI